MQILTLNSNNKQKLLLVAHKEITINKIYFLDIELHDEKLSRAGIHRPFLISRGQRGGVWYGNGNLSDDLARARS